MSIYEESGFRFDFSAALDSRIHDKAEPHDGNTFWTGIDFRVIEPHREIWIEVKSWSFKRITERTSRKRAQADFLNKMVEDGVEEFRSDVVKKFLGTSCYLSWSGKGLPENVLYIVFLEPPRTTGRSLLAPFQQRLRDEFKNAQARSWGSRITYKVVDLTQFQAEFPNYPVERV